MKPGTADSSRHWAVWTAPALRAPSMGRVEAGPPQNGRDLDLACGERGGFRPEVLTLVKQLIHFEKFS